jgi:hypothetical protein
MALNQEKILEGARLINRELINRLRREIRLIQMDLDEPF